MLLKNNRIKPARVDLVHPFFRFGLFTFKYIIVDIVEFCELDLVCHWDPLGQHVMRMDVCLMGHVRPAGPLGSKWHNTRSVAES